MKAPIQTLTNLTLVSAMVVISFACKKDTLAPPASDTDYGQGIFIVNEGPFNSGSGTITWFDKDGMNRIAKLYQQTNNLVPLGNLAQSMTIVNGDGLIVVNNANLIRVVSLTTFQEKGKIENIELPRFCADPGDGTVWVTSWENKVVIYDAVNFTKIDEAESGTGPERLMPVGEEMWVLNQGGFSIDSTVTVFDINSKQVIQTLQVYPKPTGIQVDKDGMVWVMCSGFGWNGWPDPADTEGHLVCIDPVNYTIVKDLEFPNTNEHPEKLEMNAAGDVLYYIYPGGIYKQNISGAILELTQVISRSGIFYGLDYDAQNEIIYTTEAGDFMQDGWVFRYHQTGELIDSLQAGIGPTDVCIP